VRFSWQRVVLWVVLLVVGAAYGTAGTVAHSYRLGAFPLGLTIAIVGTAALLIAVRALTSDRRPVLACGVGLVLATLVFSGKGPGGSVIVPGGGLDMIGPVNLGVVWAVAVPVLALAVMSWPDTTRVRSHPAK
jgi:glycerol uptake facilitator-like aquaporin